MIATVASPPTDVEFLHAAWSPYVAGALIGLLVALSMLISRHPIGASSAYARVMGLMALPFARRHLLRLKYYQDSPPKLNWFVMLVTFAVVGSFLAALTGGELTGRWNPPMWTDRFGDTSLVWRLAAAFFGGGLMALGARIAGGCTSGHGISGTLQLSVGSWITVICFFLGSIAMAFLLF